MLTHAAPRDPRFWHDDRIRSGVESTDRRWVAPDIPRIMVLGLGRRSKKKRLFDLRTPIQRQ